VAPNWEDRTGPIIRWAYGYTAKKYNNLDDLRAECFSPEGSLATTHRGVFDDYITFWLPLFTQENVVGRAPVMFHEALHYRTGMSHNCGPNNSLDQYFWTDYVINSPCTPFGGCTSINPNPQHPSVHAWTILWLVDYYFNVNASTNPSMQQWAKYSAGARIDNRFCTPSSVPQWMRDEF
jgi:hypothetical protein